MSFMQKALHIQIFNRGRQLPCSGQRALAGIL